MTNIRITMKTKGYEVKQEGVDSSNPLFIYNKGVYIIDHSAIRRIEREQGVLEEEAELIFHEGDPLPDGSVMPHGNVLYEIVLNKIVDATSETHVGMFDGFFKSIKKLIGL
jgi:hypothetical protein